MSANAHARVIQMRYRRRAGLGRAGFGAASWQDIQNMLDRQMPLSIEESLAAYQAGDFAGAVGKCQSAKTWLRANIDPAMHGLGWDVPNVLSTFVDSMPTSTGQADAQTAIGILLQLYPLYEQQVTIGSGGLVTSSGPGGLFPVVSTTAAVLSMMLTPQTYGYFLTMIGIGALKAFQLAVGFAGVSIPQSGNYDDATYGALTQIVARLGGQPGNVPTPAQVTAWFQAALQQAQQGGSAPAPTTAPAPPPAPTPSTPTTAPSTASDAGAWILGGLFVIAIGTAGALMFVENRRYKRDVAKAKKQNATTVAA